MSFWNNEEEYKVKLAHFTERFIAHNTCVKLFTEKRIVNEQGKNKFEYTPIWQGMDWQITESYVNSDYFKYHQDVLPCPYSENNVVKVTSVDISGEFADEVSLVIDDLGDWL